MLSDKQTLTFMVFAEDIRQTILKLADETGPENSFGPSDVAVRVNKKNPHELLEQVYFVASVLIKEGKIRATSFAGNSSNSDEPSLRFSKVRRS